MEHVMVTGTQYGAVEWDGAVEQGLPLKDLHDDALLIGKFIVPPDEPRWHMKLRTLDRHYRGRACNENTRREIETVVHSLLSEALEDDGISKLDYALVKERLVVVGLNSQGYKVLGVRCWLDEYTAYKQIKECKASQKQRPKAAPAFTCYEAPGIGIANIAVFEQFALGGLQMNSKSAPGLFMHVPSQRLAYFIGMAGRDGLDKSDLKTPFFEWVDTKEFFWVPSMEFDRGDWKRMDA